MERSHPLAIRLRAQQEDFLWDGPHRKFRPQKKSFFHISNIWRFLSGKLKVLETRICTRHWKTRGYCRIILHNPLSTGRGAELRCSEILGGNKNWKMVWKFLIKLSMHLLYVPEKPPLDIYQWEVNTYMHTKIYVLVFVGTLLMIAQNRKPPKCLVIGK